jgi:ribosome biogenesis protein UTP30
MAKDTLIDDRVSTSQITKAAEALHAYESKKQAQREETELLPDREPNIWLNVTVKQVAPKNKIKPVKMCVRLSRFGSQESEPGP